MLPDGFGDHGPVLGRRLTVAAVRVHARKGGAHFLQGAA